MFVLAEFYERFFSTKITMAPIIAMAAIMAIVA